MKVEKEELVSALSQFNPWWNGESIPDLPTWKRAAYHELSHWVLSPPAPRAVMLSGARQVGKTTLMLQLVEELLRRGVPCQNILYATFDHPLLKLSTLESVMEAWRLREPKQEGPEFVLLDEVQFARDWGTWIKHQVDFNKSRRIAFTGSATPLIDNAQESGVGRWHTLRLTTLSFYEYIQLKNLPLPALPEIGSLKELFSWEPQKFLHVGEIAHAFSGHFREYLLRGGFPQTAKVESISQSQKLLREDIVDKVLKRDMTAMFGVRHVIEIEMLFLYLCRHDGGILNIQTLLENFEGIKRPTVERYLHLLESAHLIYRLAPYGYGKEVLRGRYKIFLADAAIAGAVMMLGKNALDNPKALGVAAEAAVIKHLFAHYYTQNIHFSYWRKKVGSKEREVDLIAEIAGETMPFEVKYQNSVHPYDLDGLKQFCCEKTPQRAYVVTKSLKDFKTATPMGNTQLLHIPAELLCYWMGRFEIRR